MNISHKIRQLQKKDSISQKELTERIGFSVSAFNTALKRNDFKISVLIKIADVFNVPVSYFFGEEQENLNTKKLLSIFKKLSIYDNGTIAAYSVVFKSVGVKGVVNTLSEDAVYDGAFLRYSELDKKEVKFLIENNFISPKIISLLSNIDKYSKHFGNKVSNL